MREIMEQIGGALLLLYFGSRLLVVGIKILESVAV